MRNAAGRARRAAFEAFRRREGERLTRFARYEALAEHFQAHLPDSAGTHWERWPSAYRRPERAAVVCSVCSYAVI